MWTISIMNSPLGFPPVRYNLQMIPRTISVAFEGWLFSKLTDLFLGQTLEETSQNISHFLRTYIHIDLIHTYRSSLCEIMQCIKSI